MSGADVHSLTDDLLDAELSLLAFQHRVLAMAADRALPLVERFRFLGIVSSNLDELYMVRMAELRRAVLAAPPETRSEARAGEPTAAAATLAHVEAEIARLLAAMSAHAASCLRDAARHGVELLSWQALHEEERVALREVYMRDIQPTLHSHAVTLSPGYPVPHLAHFGLFVAVVYRDAHGARLRVAEHEVPRDLPRLLPVPGRTRCVITLDEVLRANVPSLYPDVIVEGAHLFRVTRGGELPMGDDDSEDLLDAVDRATARRPLNPAVRLEVDRTMPGDVSALLLESLHREASEADRPVTATAAQVVDGVLDLRCLAELPLPSESPSLRFPALEPRSAFGPGSLFEQIRHGDRLVHHPFESFDDSVVRFFEEAAADAQATSLAATLYRVGNPSPIAGALLLAAEAGKRVFAFVELQARFDEAHNVRWARAIERAGGQVVYGLPGLKVHAKAALVVRREGDVLRRYVHVGSGNYNVRTGRQYTDLSLFSSRPALGEDIATLFRALAGGDGTPPHAVRALPNEALAAPHQLRPALLALIDREIGYAEAGMPAAITIKVNALADREMVRALYRASEAGVDVQLIVRGICTLRPGVAPYSSRIRVVSVVGRFLEHSRVYRFANGGAPIHYIGSSDLRPRNLRRRIELLVPVHDPAHRTQLDALLARYLDDPTAWELASDGQYITRQGRGPSAQTWYLDVP